MLLILYIKITTDQYHFDCEMTYHETWKYNRIEQSITT